MVRFHLPAPVNAQSQHKVPTYAQRNKTNARPFVPRVDADFDDGGAYPEVIVAQYPLDMGRKHSKKSDALTTQAGAIVAAHNVGANEGKKVFANASALVPLARQGGAEANSLQRPTEEEEDETARRTIEALSAKAGQVLAKTNPTAKTSMLGPRATNEPTYVKYTPANAAMAEATGITQRIVKVVEMPVDPLEPPKFKGKKAPRAPEEMPVPVLHEPPKKLTVEDQKAWKIPPCVSNWKNSRGYTIALDKRLAADGRGIQEVSINDNFAKLSEAMYVAEQKAREAVNARAKVSQELKLREKERREVELRDLAQRARVERGGLGDFPPPPPMPPPSMHRDGGDDGVVAVAAAAAVAAPNVGGAAFPPPPPMPPPPGMGYDDTPERGAAGDETPPYLSGDDVTPQATPERHGGDDDDDADAAARRDRDAIREERRRERERERRMDNKRALNTESALAGVAGGESLAKRSKLTRDRDRDISEKVALGQASVNVGQGGAGAFDQRLFDREGGLGQGLMTDDAYNIYEGELFTDRSKANLYAPTGASRRREADDAMYGGGGAEGERKVDTDRFRAKQPLGLGAGKDEAGEGGAAARSAGPVMFEKERKQGERKQGEDLFGLDSFLSEVRQPKK